MDRPKPRIINNVASFIMNKFAGAKMAVQVALQEKRHAAEADVNNRATRRYRSKYNWWNRPTRGQQNVGVVIGALAFVYLMDESSISDEGIFCEHEIN